MDGRYQARFAALMALMVTNFDYVQRDAGARARCGFNFLATPMAC